ncbi:MAG TPA: hypothetical protein DCY35_11390 [Prolixibacteraceae bacterium]|nr:hypothetical protein [Prolixibacteraceae bacterium]
MTNKDLYEFIGQCLALTHQTDSRDHILDMVSGETIDWEKFVSVCSKHLITPAIYLQFQCNDLLPYLPENLVEYLAEITMSNARRNENIIRQMIEITQILREYQIYPVFLKGSGNLIDHLYPDQACRMMGDIDFLVREEDFLKSVQIMKDNGYHHEHPVFGDPTTFKHYPRLWKQNRVADIEIHRIPVSEKYNKWFNYQVIANEMVTPKGLSDCFVLSDNHKIILNYIHSQLSHSGEAMGIVSYRDIYDLHLLNHRYGKPVTGIDSRYQKSASTYFQMANRLLHLPGSEEKFHILDRNLFYQIHQLNLSSRTFYQTHRAVRKLVSLIKVYTKILCKAHSSKEIRKLVINRLSQPQWYRAHFKMWKSVFVP